MSSDPAADVVVEPIFVVEATYAPDGAESRKPVRASHLARLADLRDQRVVIEAGGFADVSASLFLVRAEDEDAALQIFRDDIYMKHGVWVELRVKRFGRVCRPSELA
jgi:uncharacterized protein YciI